MRFTTVLVASCLSLIPFVQALTYHGADISSLAVVEGNGIRYRESSSAAVQPFETILKNHGMNLARIRIWTGSQYSLSYGLALAKRAHNAGMKLLIDLHYSDNWADPGKQAIPSSWPTDLSGLNTKIYTYTKDLVTSFASQGTPIDFLQVGNEINDGLLWPTGRISVNGYSPASQMLHSAVNGARAASSSVKTMIHIANGWNSAEVNNFFSKIFIQGQLATGDVDVMGFSFYPFYGTGATLSALKNSMNSIISKYGKDIMIVETDWPASCTSSVQLSEGSFGASAAGQQKWVAGIRDVVSGLSGGHGLGIVYWEPGWIGNANLGSGCADNLLVDGSGTVRSSINMFSASM